MRRRLPRELRLRRANVEHRRGPSPVPHVHWRSHIDFDVECYDCTSSAHRTGSTIMGSPEAVEALWDLCHRTPLRREISERIAKLA